MKAMVLNGPNLPFELVQRPDPVAGPGEAVARVITCGAGLTIQHAKTGRRKIEFPRIIGHEITGEIVEVGAGARGLKVGDPVTTYFYLNCGHCGWCLQNLEPLCDNTGGQVGLECDGAYAEYVKLPAQNFIKLPAGLDYKKHPAEIGVVTDALATPYKVLRRADIKAGESGCVIGGKWTRHSPVDDGAVGEDARHRGRYQAGQVRRVPQGGRRRNRRCQQGQCRRAVTQDLTGGQGVDVVADYVSTTATLEAGAKALGRRGRLVTLGGGSAAHLYQSACGPALHQAERCWPPGSRYVTRAEVLESLQLVERGEVFPLVTVVRPLEQAERGRARIGRTRSSHRARRPSR